MPLYGSGGIHKLHAFRIRILTRACHAVMPYFGFLHVLLHIDLLRGLADDHREFRHCARLEIVDLGLKAGRKTENHRNADNADAGSKRGQESSPLLRVQIVE